ncbi:MAG: DUF3396 domain-containing protein [Ketobacter sp.]|nr:MAG: DUF3396 domain-containing protein [Ketobacter sp.]
MRMLNDTHEANADLPETLKAMLPIRDTENKSVLKVCPFLTLYFKNAHLESTRMAVADCVEEFLAAFKDDIEWGLLGVGKPQAAGTFSENATRNYLQSVDVTNDDGWQIYWQSDAPNEASDCGLQAFGKSQQQSEELGHLSYLSVHFPLQSPLSEPEALLELALRWCEKLDPFHGYGGMGIIHSSDRFVAAQHEIKEYALAQRFPALEVDYPLKHALWSREGIKGGNWLTILSSYWDQKLKQGDSQFKLSAAFEIHPYSGGIIIRAGKSPIVADHNSGAKTPIYNELAQALHPIRLTTHPAVHTSQGKFTRQAFEEWLERFDN